MPRLSRQLNQIERLCFPVGHQRRQTPTLPRYSWNVNRGNQRQPDGWICTLTVAFQRVREAKVTTDCYHWAFLREIRRGKYLILNWLPPRDSNPDTLIQRQEAGDSAEFPRSTDYLGNSFLFSMLLGAWERRITSPAIIRQPGKTRQTNRNVTGFSYRISLCPIC